MREREAQSLARNNGVAIAILLFILLVCACDILLESILKDFFLSVYLFSFIILNLIWVKYIRAIKVGQELKIQVEKTWFGQTLLCYTSAAVFFFFNRET